MYYIICIINTHLRMTNGHKLGWKITINVVTEGKRLGKMVVRAKPEVTSSWVLSMSGGHWWNRGVKKWSDRTGEEGMWRLDIALVTQLMSLARGVFLWAAVVTATAILTSSCGWGSLITSIGLQLGEHFVKINKPFTGPLY